MLSTYAQSHKNSGKGGETSWSWPIGIKRTTLVLYQPISAVTMMAEAGLNRYFEM